MKTPLILTTLALVTALVSSLMTLGTAFAEPEISEASVQNGDVLDAVPEFLSLCFSEPVVNDDLQPDVADPWAFTVRGPDERPLGLRIVFDAAGDCVEVFPGTTAGDTDGIWTFEWFVTSQEAAEEANGVITFRVGPGDPPVPFDDGGGDDDSIDFALVIGLAVAAGALAVVVTASWQYLKDRRSA